MSLKQNDVWGENLLENKVGTYDDAILQYAEARLVYMDTECFKCGARYKKDTEHCRCEITHHFSGWRFCEDCNLLKIKEFGK